jgi:hypothetical protein
MRGASELSSFKPHDSCDVGVLSLHTAGMLLFFMHRYTLSDYNRAFHKVRVQNFF